MGINLSEALINTPQREVAGSRTATRYDYQKNWALVKMLEYHKEDRDYVFAFEFHDDVLILDSEHNPEVANFYQVKTKDSGKPWSINELIKTEKGKDSVKLSILGKLYLHKLKFAGYIIGLHFITNARFSFLPANSESIKNSNLKDSEKEKIINNIKIQVPGLNQLSLDDINFCTTPLSLNDCEHHTKGRVHDFFLTVMGKFYTISTANSWCKTIMDEIKRKNNSPNIEFSSFGEFIKKKCITRNYIEDTLAEIRKNNEILPDWAQIIIYLKGNGITDHDLIGIGNSWNAFKVDRLDIANNRLLSTYVKYIVNTIEKLYKAGNSLFINMTVIFEDLKSKNLIDSQIYTDFYIKAVILWKICEKS